MNALYEWGIPSLGFLIWVVLILTLIPPLMRYLMKRAEQTRHPFDEVLVSTLGVPLILFFVALGLSFYLDAIPPLPKKWIKYSDALLIILFILAGYLLVDRLMMEILRRYSKKVDIISSSAGVIKTLYRAIILGFVFLIVLDRLKIAITPFLASLGIGGLVVALALQDTLSNFFSGIYIFFDKPIRIGDYIMLESGQEGYVTQIGWRNTRIRMLPNNVVIVPNTKLVSNQITNFYLPEPEMAVLVQVGVSYQSDLEKVERVTIEVAKQVLQEVEGGVKEFEPFTRYHTFSDFSINFTVILRAVEYVHKYLITHEFIKRLHRRYQQEGIEIPFPIRTVYMKNESSKG
ncbi:MAG TPA: mechanosensitive ion channel family protein [Thermodesulfobacteriota bacterium]|nr:mechanosensitive ion channel family protein [Thermodesulfobacteriota bacterium]